MAALLLSPPWALLPSPAWYSRPDYRSVCWSRCWGDTHARRRYARPGGVGRGGRRAAAAVSPSPLPQKKARLEADHVNGVESPPNLIDDREICTPSIRESPQDGKRCVGSRSARAARAGPSSALSGAVRATRGAARAARHSPRQAVQRQSRLTNTARSTSMLLAMQQNAAPACSRRCGAAAPPPRLIRGAGARRHGPPLAAGGARLSVEAQNAFSPPAALRSAGHRLRRAKPTPRLP